MKVSACLLTRGNVPMEQIVETLPYDEVLVWDNSVEQNLRTFGRFELALTRAQHDVIYFQDDDVIFKQHDELMQAYKATPELLVANDGHGGNYGGYEDLAWTCCGSLAPKALIAEVWERWFSIYPFDSTDEQFLYEADAVFGILAPFRHVKLGWERLYADDNTRLCRQPWQESLKAQYANLAREVREGVTL